MLDNGKIKSILPRSKKWFVIMLIPGAFVLTTYSVYAAYPVFDAQNVAKTIKVIENTAKQIEKLNEQVNLAKKHLSIVTQSMKDISDNAKKVLSAVDGTRNAVDGVIKNTQSSFKGLLSPIKDIQNDVLSSKLNCERISHTDR